MSQEAAQVAIIGSAYAIYKDEYDAYSHNFDVIK
jgi:hypothetical protein